MILGTFSGADYPLNAMPVRGMQEVTQAYRDPMCKMRVARKRSPLTSSTNSLMKNGAVTIFSQDVARLRQHARRGGKKTRGSTQS